MSCRLFTNSARNQPLHRAVNSLYNTTCLTASIVLVLLRREVIKSGIELRPLTGPLSIPHMMHDMKHWWKYTDRLKSKNSEKNLSQCPLSITYPTYCALGPNPVLYCEKHETNRLSCSIILYFDQKCIYSFRAILRVNSDYFPEQD